GINVDDESVGASAVIDQREDGRITHVAAVPIMLASDLDRLEHERQAGGGEDRIDEDLPAGENLHLAGAHVGRREVELDRAFALQLFEIDDLFENRLQRVD